MKKRYDELFRLLNEKRRIEAKGNPEPAEVEKLLAIIGTSKLFRSAGNQEGAHLRHVLHKITKSMKFLQDHEMRLSSKINKSGLKNYRDLLTSNLGLVLQSSRVVYSSLQELEGVWKNQAYFLKKGNLSKYTNLLPQQEANLKRIKEQSQEEVTKLSALSKDLTNKLGTKLRIELAARGIKVKGTTKEVLQRWLDTEVMQDNPEARETALVVGGLCALLWSQWIFLGVLTQIGLFTVLGSAGVSLLAIGPALAIYDKSSFARRFRRQLSRKLSE
jgi:hypothetical protein